MVKGMINFVLWKESDAGKLMVFGFFTLFRMTKTKCCPIF